MTDDDAPKSAIELAMARLKKRDVDTGSVETPLNDAQKAEITEVRQMYAARRAQAEIMHKASLASAVDVEGLAQLHEEFRRDTDRMQRELDEKVAAIRRRLA
jgi:hypothetical protein